MVFQLSHVLAVGIMFFGMMGLHELFAIANAIGAMT